jgi:hypothetical protein
VASAALVDRAREFLKGHDDGGFLREAVEEETLRT